MRENNEITSIFNRQGKDHIVALLECYLTAGMVFVPQQISVQSQQSPTSKAEDIQNSWRSSPQHSPYERQPCHGLIFTFFLTLSINNSCIFCKDLTRKEIVPSFISFQFCSTFTAAKESGNSKFSFYLP